MKRSIIIIAAVFPLLFSACTFLDQSPEQLNTVDKVFSSRNETRKWFFRLYSMDYFLNMLEGATYYNHYMFGSDETNNALDAHLVNLLNGSLSPEMPVAGWDNYYWDVYYQAIRHANIFLENVDKCKELELIELNKMKAEARFMRAVYHFWLLSDYGPIPIVKESFSNGMRGRDTYDDCIDWIVNEMDEASKDMYDERSELDWGYPTSGTALAMKSRVLLYAASPLFNGNRMYANFRNPDGKVLINQTYDNEKWKKAADAAKAVIDLHRYSLKKCESATPTFDEYVKNLRTISTEWNDEIIWARPQGTDWYCRSSWPACFQGWCAKNAITLEMANSYFMADGSVAKDLNEWFSNKEWSTADGDGTIANTFSMFVGREPRFYANLHFPNQRVDYSSPHNPGNVMTLEMWYFGNSGKSVSSGDHNTTGLSPRKHIALNSYSDKALGEYGTAVIPFPVIRLAEIYLNYCEAMNEYQGEATHAEILPYLNEIRERAGVPAYTGSYTKEEMREMIRHERQVELFLEMHRYFDVRRWMIAHGENGVLNTPVHGLDISRGENATDPSFFEMKEGLVRTFRVEHYLAPIKASEVAYNTNLVQAPYY